MALTDGIVGCWSPSIKGSSYLLPDLTGRGNHGTLTNMDAGSDWPAVSIRGVSGRVLDFDGVNDGVNLGASSALNPTLGISCSLWVNPAASSNAVAWFIGRDDATLGRSFAFGGRFNLAPAAMWLQINGASTLIGTTAIPRSEWSMVTFTGSPGVGYRVFFNGASDGTAGWTAPPATTGATTIGQRTYAGSQGYTTGLIGETVMWNRGLTLPEVAELFRLGNGGIGRQLTGQTRRRTYGYVPPSFRAYWARRQNQIIGGGV